jgi:hypothetical protein
LGIFAPSTVLSGLTKEFAEKVVVVTDRDCRSLKLNITDFATKNLNRAFDYTSWGLRTTGFWWKNQALPSCLLI